MVEDGVLNNDGMLEKDDPEGPGRVVKYRMFAQDEGFWRNV